MSLRDKLRDLPTDSGVYIYMDGDGKVLYVGKAKNLRNRVRQYFFVSSNKTEKVMAMLTHIADMRYIITKSETDALALENTLIKKYSPPYNIMLKDDKQYPFVRLDLRRTFPRPEITRKVVDDGAKYFGPVMGSTKQLLAMLGDIFPTAACRLDFKKLPKNFRACLNYHIGRCSAPCIGKVDKETYDGYVKGIIEFLNGNTRQAEQRLTELMNQASQAGNFEKAIVYRDRLRLIERIKETKLVTLGKPVNLDVFAIAHNGRTAVVNQTMVRQGKVLLVENYPVTDAGLDERQTLSSFLTMYFSATNSVGSQVLLNCCPDDLAALEQLLYERYGKKIRVFMPVRGVKKQLTEMAYSNAAEQLEKSQAKSDRHEAKTSGAVRDLKNLLGLSSLPRRMECYDISNISGTDKVASMVVFTDGEKDASQYRRFKIKTVEGANDFASMEEVLNRRLSRLKEGDEGFGKRPDLIVAGRRAAVCAAVGHPAEAAPPGERPAGRCRRHRAGTGRAAAAIPCPRRSRSCGPAALVRPADAVARAGGGLAGRCAGAGCARGRRLPEIKALCGAGLQNARRLLRRGVRAHAVHTGLCAPARLPAGQPSRPGAAGCAAA